MPINIIERESDLFQEKKILKALITNTEFCKQIVPYLEYDTFSIVFAKIISQWVTEYFNEYHEAPNKIIQDIYNTKKEKLGPDTAQLVSDFLLDLGREFASEERPNTEYLIKSTRPYLQKRYFENLAEKLSSFSKLGKISECEKLLLDKKGVAAGRTISVNLHDKETVQRVIINAEQARLFMLPGKLGDLLGIFESGRVYGVLGKSGIGKSFFLNEIAMSAATERLRVVMANWEMNETQIGMRWYKSISNLGDVAKVWVYPIIDCEKSQLGICTLKKNRVPLVDSLGVRPVFGQHNPKYEPCSLCRNEPDFRSVIWYDSVYRDMLDTQNIINTINAFNLMYGDNIRVAPFPKFNATLTQLEHELRMLDYRENFVPSVLTIDYDDLILPERFYVQQRDNSDEIYKHIGRVAQEYNLCVFLASQVNREGAKKKTAKSTDIGNDWRKYQHLDGLMVLNQTDEEKEEGYIRISSGKVRDGYFNPSREVMVLQNLGLGQALLDSEYFKKGEV